MARPSKLTNKQWADIRRRLLAGEKAANLAREFGVSRASISTKVTKRLETVKTVANQIVAADHALRSLPVTEQLETLTLADDLRAISMHLAGAGKFGAATAHRLSGIAHAKVAEIDDAEPLSAESMESLKGIAALTKVANESSIIPMGLLNANKDFIRSLNDGGNQTQDELMKELVQYLPD